MLVMLLIACSVRYQSLLVVDFMYSTPHQRLYLFFFVRVLRGVCASVCVCVSVGGWVGGWVGGYHAAPDGVSTAV
jgi:hypothetical protein